RVVRDEIAADLGLFGQRTSGHVGHITYYTRLSRRVVYPWTRGLVLQPERQATNARSGGKIRAPAFALVFREGRGLWRSVAALSF
ncbi:MAG TPA: hypothetical protein VLD67_07350, partial [Vicinamibacterales bacterium]|nr:hypothetical protein [Vicinamibacterales bacterium]